MNQTNSSPDSINSNLTLINIQIPSFELLKDKSGWKHHHVYQVKMKIKNEEWTVYRRFTHFDKFNKLLVAKYPIISTISFPEKKLLVCIDFSSNINIAKKSMEKVMSILLKNFPLC